MCEPFTLSTVFASVGSALKVADVAVRIAEVGSENDVFVRMIHNVRDSLAEVERLLNSGSVRTKLAETPAKVPWIQRTINSSRSALNDIGRWVERARAEQQSTGSIQFTTRVRWILNDHEKLVNRTAELNTCHQQLSTVLNYLTPLESAPSGKLKPVLDHGVDLNEIFSKHRRRTICHAPISASTTSVETSQPKVRKSDLSYMRHFDHQATESFESRKSTRSSDSNLDNDRSHQGWSSFREPPASPPPSYSTVMESVIRTRQAHMDQKTRLHEPQHKDQPRSRMPSSYNRGDVKVENTWEYRVPDTIPAVSELAGYTVNMSGTNSLGPVNPYEYSTAHVSVANTNAAADKVENVVELMGDMGFVAQLPGNEVGSPPGYPLRSNERVPSPSPGHASSRVPLEQQRMPMYELSAVPKRRPVPSHTVSEPVPGPHSFPPALQITELDGGSQERAYVTKQYQRTTGNSQIYARPVGVSAASLSPSPQRSLISPDIASLPSQRATRIDRSLAPAASHVSLQHKPSTSWIRMQRQKQMMDFVGSLG
ncbi:hypothetical protein NX059_009337 [Plenodomus lindquistii]|nr:hypothetical protein NX059_009337 [Plenodomus lindquistii]